MTHQIHFQKAHTQAQVMTESEPPGIYWQGFKKSKNNLILLSKYSYNRTVQGYLKYFIVSGEKNYTLIYQKHTLYLTLIKDKVIILFPNFCLCNYRSCQKTSVPRWQEKKFNLFCSLIFKHLRLAVDKLSHVFNLTTASSNKKLHILNIKTKIGWGYNLYPSYYHHREAHF